MPFSGHRFPSGSHFHHFSALFFLYLSLALFCAETPVHFTLLPVLSVSPFLYTSLALFRATGSNSSHTTLLDTSLSCLLYISNHVLSCISNIDNTSHEEETSNNRRKTKSLHCPQLDHHDADGLAGHKDWRTTQTIMRRYKRPLISIF
jgi:hypothetical protein